MDSALKQDAIIAEVTQGTTPATPPFKLLRTSSITGSPKTNTVRSPERTSNRQALAMVTGIGSTKKTINMPFARDAGLDILLASAFNAAFSTDALKLGSTLKPFTLEEKYTGATTPYRRSAGMIVDSASFNFTTGQPASCVFNCVGLAETTATSAIASSTYAAPSPGYDPLGSVQITVNSLFGLSSPKVTALNFTIANNVREQTKFGSASPWGTGLGLLDITGTIEFYFSVLADYSGFIPRLTGQTLDVTIGSVANFKDQIVMNAVDVYDPDISDPGPTGDCMVSAPFMAKYYASDASAMIWNRNVA